MKKTLLFALISSVAFLSACGGGGSDTGAVTTPSSTTSTAAANYAGKWSGSLGGSTFYYQITQNGNSISLENITPGLPSGQTLSGTISGNTATVSQNDSINASTVSISFTSATSASATQSSCVAKPGYVCLVPNNVPIPFTLITPATTAPAVATPTATITAACSASNFTTEKYNAIQKGMTFEQVSQVIGCQNDSTRTYRGTSTDSYNWNYSSGTKVSMIVVYFDQSGEILKSSAGF